MITATKKVIALIGGGPAALFMYKRLVDLKSQDYQVHIFEKKDKLGAGMPYSEEGANREHITNVSDNEIPELVNSMEEWIIKAPANVLQPFNITPDNFNEYKVVPRLLFGEYLSAQFEKLRKAAKEEGIETFVHFNTTVTDVIDDAIASKVTVVTETDSFVFDEVVICTGHHWPKKTEETVKGYFDSPYPPAKIRERVNFPVAIKGSSLTSLDALRTLARSNGHFSKNDNGKLEYHVNEESQGFKIVMHSIDGLLPAIRIHLEDSHLSKEAVLTETEIESNKLLNDGFVSLDYIFEQKFKIPFRKKDPDFYERIKDMKMEEFVEDMMSLRERLDPFTLFKAEYAEAEKSIRRQQPVLWKEMLASLSFTMNYPAKYFSAEDMLRHRKVLLPLISIVIAFVPQSSAQEMIALQEAGILSIVAVDRSSRVVPGEEEGITYFYKDENGNEQEVKYKMFIDCVGQPPLSIQDIPFKGLIEKGTISQARLQFRSSEAAEKLIEERNKDVVKEQNGSFTLKMSGIMINDSFQVIDKYGAYNDRIYVMAVPYIGGINPDYSGLDFCEAASAKIIKALVPTSPHYQA
jgi:uncharacterized NAD(P)/FAD-binding protein YdhS